MEDIRSLTMGIIFTALCYTCVPIYLRFIKEKLYPNPQKICIKISIIVCIIGYIKEKEEIAGKEELKQKTKKKKQV